MSRGQVKRAELWAAPGEIGDKLGHADFADYGEDIVCAAVSAVLQAARLGLSEFTGCEIGVEQKSGPEQKLPARGIQHILFALIRFEAFFRFEAFVRLAWFVAHIDSLLVLLRPRIRSTGARPSPC